MASKFNFAPVVRCSTGPTTGCWEQGRPFEISYDYGEGIGVKHVETRVFCKYHGPWIARTSGPGYSFRERRVV